tara:strand:+ start:2221 stop:3252 length:1032 start_codon:yes stop_codon:yes gene_type:complete
MKIQKKANKTSIIKKIFIKICRILGYEIIDQSNFSLPVTDQAINEDLSLVGKRSLTMPMGEVKITRPVKSLTIILRTCASVNMLTQSKKRIFDSKKSEYTLRSLISIINSVNFARHLFEKIKIEIIIVDHMSEKNVIDQIKSILSKQSFKSRFIQLNIDNFKKNINPINEKNEKVSDNQISNMSNIHQSLLLAKECEDLVYFVEDDYIHTKGAIKEMILTYEKLSSLLNREIILCPSDYPYLYSKIVNSSIFLGDKNHWRSIKETLCTFLMSNEIVIKYWDQLISTCKFEHYPFEKPFHKIYEKEYCLSPIPSLAIHFTNINSVFGLSPNVDWKKVWDESVIK